MAFEDKRRVRWTVLGTTQVGSPYLEPAVMSLSGRVIAVDRPSRQITVRRAPISADTAKGYAFYQHARKEGQRVALTETARLRLAEVTRWLADQNGEITILADDAVDYCLNGEFDGGFNSIAVGDFVGVRYYVDHQSGDLLVPHTIRISKPIR